jgi:metallo-beta-lactamase class B
VTAAFLLGISLVAQQSNQREEWNATKAGFKVFGNTYWVGTKGLGSILVTSDAGHVLLDGALPESVPKIIGNIRALGFRVEDVKVIGNTHVHYDHAGGVADLQRASGARVVASRSAASVLRTGLSGPDDPQFGILPPLAKVSRVAALKDGEVVRVGPLALTAHLTPGHTPGGTSWTWRSCEGARCLNMVYADSLSPVSADAFTFTTSALLKGFESSFRVIDAMPCDVLLTPHPAFANVLEKLAARDAGTADAFVDTGACRRYAAGARENLKQRVAREQGAR